MKVWQVNIIESERGWGQKIDETFYFSDGVLAKEFVEMYNALNSDPKAPDIYWKADIPTIITLPDRIINSYGEMVKLLPPVVKYDYRTNKSLDKRG